MNVYKNFRIELDHSPESNISVMLGEIHNRLSEISNFLRVIAVKTAKLEIADVERLEFPTFELLYDYYTKKPVAMELNEETEGAIGYSDKYEGLYLRSSNFEDREERDYAFGDYERRKGLVNEEKSYAFKEQRHG